MSIEVKVGQIWQFVCPIDYKKYHEFDETNYSLTITNIVNNGYEAIGDLLYEDGVEIKNIKTLVEDIKTICYYTLSKDVDNEN